MDLSNDLVYEFAKSTNDGNEQIDDSTVYGTVKIIDDEPYACLDGSDNLYTPISTTTEVKDYDRVLIQIKNHTAIVIGNTTDISVSKTTANEMESSITAEIKKTDSIETRVKDIEGNYSTLQQTVNGFNTTVSDINGKYTTLQQTIDGFTFKDGDGTVKIDGGSINLTGSISFTDLDEGAQNKINQATIDADNAAKSATSAANSANSASGSAINASNSATSAANSANSALGSADMASYQASLSLTYASNASQAATEARQIANSIVLPTYLNGTYIDNATIMSPVIIGGKIYAVGYDEGDTSKNSWTEMTASGLRVYTNGANAPKIELIDNDDSGVDMFLGSGTYEGDGTDNRGRFRIHKRSDRTVLTYYSGEYPEISANLVFGDNGCIIARRANSKTGETNAVTVLAGVDQEGADY